MPADPKELTYYGDIPSDLGMKFCDKFYHTINTNIPRGTWQWPSSTSPPPHLHPQQAYVLPRHLSLLYCRTHRVPTLLWLFPSSSPSPVTKADHH